MNHVEEIKKLRAAAVCNCTQSLLVAFAPDMGMDAAEAKKLGTFFGGGMLCGSTCGVLSGALLILGRLGYTKPEAQALLRQFREDHGATDCAVLLAAATKKGIDRKTHCDDLIIEMAARLDAILK